ncbi:MAG: twin-arginine translocation signal domain-containing protein, partial [Proteobacteria bacterium]|nr:twin-arginine translocation signal domain-containing protein [Pseudomonadota bacterium]
MPTRRNFLGATAAALALGSGVSARAQQEPEAMTADLILRNGRF